MNTVDYIRAVVILGLVLGAILAPVLSLWLLWLLRRAVVRGMALSAGAEPAAEPSADVQPSPPPTAELVLSKYEAAGVSSGSPVTKQVLSSLARVGFVYLLGSVAYAIVLASYWLVASGFSLTRLLGLTITYAWPAVLLLFLASSIGRRQQITIIGIYALCLAGVSAYVLARNPGTMDVSQVVKLWLLCNAPATLLLLAFLPSRIRSIGPLVLLFTMLGVVGAEGFLELLIQGGGMKRLIEVLVPSVDFNWILFGTYAVGFLGGVILALFLLQFVARLFQHKRLSDQALTVDAIMMLFALSQTITDDPRYGLAGFVVFAIVTRLGFAVLVRPPQQPRTLLLLRVFALGKRSERLFRAFSKAWLRIGPISMIAGPDLITAIVDPPTFLNFVARKLTREFVSNPADLEQRLAARDALPDPDGRYRTTDFFCRENMWRVTMERLVLTSDAVLMDLRSFSPERQGCRYELGQLLASVPLARVVLLVDGTTDSPLLEGALREAWQRLPAASPNRKQSKPEVRLFHYRDESLQEIAALLTLLQP